VSGFACEDKSAQVIAGYVVSRQTTQARTPYPPWDVVIIEEPLPEPDHPLINGPDDSDFSRSCEEQNLERMKISFKINEA